MEFNFDDDDNNIDAPAAAAPTPPADLPPGLKKKRPPTPPPGLKKKRPPTPPPPAEASGLLLEFDDDDDIVPPSEAPPSDEPPAKKARPAPPEPPKKPDAPFEPSSNYAGSRPGYVFKLGDAGLGYYRDAVPKKKKKKRKAVSFKPTAQAVDATATVRRVCAILQSAGGPKASKALSMLATLAGVDGGVTAETAPLYVDALRAFAASGAVCDGLVGPLGDAVEALGKADRACFSVDDRVQVATWRLSLKTARTLRETDDTYDFCSAMKRVAKAIEALQPDESDAACQRRDAIVHCLKSSWAANESKPWAKTPVEAAVLACAERRRLFSEAQRSRIDHLTTQVKTRQRGLCRVDTAPVRDVEDTSHPLREVRS